MTGAVQLNLSLEPSPTTPPPCSAEPERWFDRAHRTSALATCIECPMRRRCAREALDTRARWGMWAGIWIDGCLDAVADLLHDVATTSSETPIVGVDDPGRISTTDSERAPLPQTLPVRPGSVATAVLARSSGHCEIVADGCRFTADARLSRLPGSSVDEAASAASVFASCTPCAERLNALDNWAEAHRLGYIVESSAQLAGRLFFWRGAHWVHLGQWGQLHEVVSGAESARAS